MIQLENLGKSYAQKIVLDQVNFLFPAQKRIALTGPNGTGKTTLLNILCGLEEADSGRVIVHPGKVIGYLPQEPNPEPKPTILAEAETGASHITGIRDRLNVLVETMSHNHDAKILSEYEALQAEFLQLDGYALEAKATAILSGLGFDDAMHQQSPLQLSGGWRMRLELAKIFIRNPDFLILDEPTNHLDLPSLVWVEKYLHSFEGTLLFVSHDRSLLEKLSNHTLLLNDGELESYPHRFSKALEKKAERIAMEEAQVGNIHRKKKKMEDFVNRFGAKATKAKQAQSRMKMISKLDAQIDSIQGQSNPVQSKSINFKLPEPPPSGKSILTTTDLAIGYASPLATAINLDIERGQKIAVIGANGIGKSTLLKTIIGQLPSLAGSVSTGYQVETVYFSQNHEDTLDFERSCIENVLGGNSSIGEPEARSILGAFLFSGDDVTKPIEVLSGGEKSRVALAKVLVSKGNFLLLDEPTNHLDMDSVDALVDTVQDFKGTILFVSHDRTFIDEVCSHVFVMLPDGRNCLFEGGLADYRRMAKIQGFPDVLDFESSEPARSLKTDGTQGKSQHTPNREKQPAAKTASKKLSYEEAKELKRKIQSLEKQISKIEKRMQQLKAEKKTLQKQVLEVDPSNFTRIAELGVHESQVDKELEQLEESWLLQSEELEAIKVEP